MATKIKIIASGDFLEITPSDAMVYEKSYGFKNGFGMEIFDPWRDC
jgi:hypothetical protein